MLEQLNDRKSLLLMYETSELPADDIAQTEAMLAADAGLRAELEELRRASRLFEQGMRSLDETERSSTGAIGQRRIVRAMRQHQLQTAARLAARPVVVIPQLPLPWWVYPTAVAAAMFLAFLTWVVNYHPGPQAAPMARDMPRANETPNQNDPALLDPKVADLARDIENSFGPASQSEQNDLQLLALRDGPSSGIAGGDQDE